MQRIKNILMSEVLPAVAINQFLSPMLGQNFYEDVVMQTLNIKVKCLIIIVSSLLKGSAFSDL